MYSANVNGLKSDVTVAIYQGAGAEKVFNLSVSSVLPLHPIFQEWRHDIAKYMTVPQVAPLSVRQIAEYT
jgi:hypothetical protein